MDDQSVWNSFEIQRRNGLFCDITLIGHDGEEVKAHRNILSSKSKFFEQQLTPSPTKKVFVYPQFNGSDIEGIVRFFYNQTDIDLKLISITEDNIEILKKLAIPSIEKNVELFFKIDAFKKHGILPEMDTISEVWDFINTVAIPEEKDNEAKIYRFLFNAYDKKKLRVEYFKKYTRHVQEVYTVPQTPDQEMKPSTHSKNKKTRNDQTAQPPAKRPKLTDEIQIIEDQNSPTQFELIDDGDKGCDLFKSIESFIQYHEDIHNDLALFEGNSYWPCYCCDFNGKGRKDLLEHGIKKHVELSKGIFKCGECNEIIPFKEDVKNHIFKLEVPQHPIEWKQLGSEKFSIAKRAFNDCFTVIKNAEFKCQDFVEIISDPINDRQTCTLI